MATQNRIKSGAPVPRDQDSVVGNAVIDVNFATTKEASGDTVQIMTIPKNMWIKGIMVYGVTAEGGTLTVDVKVDSTDILAGVNLNTTGVIAAYPNVTSTSAQTGYFATAENTLDLLINNDADAAVAKVVVEYAMLSARLI